MSEKVIRELTDRVARLGAELGQLKETIGKGKGTESPWWEQIAGSQEGDEVFAEIARLGAEIRRADREAMIKKLERQGTKRRHAKAKPAVRK